MMQPEMIIANKQKVSAVIAEQTRTGDVGAEVETEITNIALHATRHTDHIVGDREALQQADAR